MVVPCEFCDSNATYDSDQPCITTEDPYEVFHSKCDTCHYESSCPDNLCSFCQHLRLRHLCLCKYGRPNFTTIEINLGKFVTFSPKKGCQFCHFISEAFQSDPPRWHGQNAGYLTSLKIAVNFYERKKEPDIRRPSGSLRLWYLDTKLNFQVGGWMVIYSLDLATISPSQSIQQLAPDSVLSSSRTLREPETLNDLAKDFANWDEIRRWTRQSVQESLQLEPSSSGSSLAPTSSYTGMLSTGFRVIDVQKRCLVRGIPDAGFVTLSYTWGPNPNLAMWMTTNALVEELEREGGITRSKTPKTIEDAILICEKLGQRYLWADRLCIVQDDDETKRQQIKSMDSIFASANFTIAVLNGTVDSGIPGVGFPRHNRRKHHEINGIAFIHEPPDVRETINASTWATRGWTYQEAVLSKHVLYFSDCQAFLEDRNYFKTEDGFGPLNTPWKTPLRPFQYPREKSAYNKFNRWIYHLSEYTKRKLTKDSDVYDAFSGISSLLYGGADENILYGLPHPVFDQAMLWYPKRSTSRRTGTLVRNPGAKGYPTWSWGSVTGPICYSTSSDWIGNLVRWIARPTDPRAERASTLRYLEPRDAGYQVAEENAMLICLGIAWSFGCIEADWPFKPFPESTFEEMKFSTRTLLNKQDSLIPRLYEILPTPAKKPAELKETYGEIPEGLATRAQTAILKVKSHEESGHDHEGGRKLEILNEMGECIGILDSEEPSVQNGLIWSPEGRAEIECMGISLERRWDIDCLVPGSYSALDKATEFPELNLTFCDKTGSFLAVPYLDCQEILVVSVIAIRWQGPYAYRASLGWILLTKWVETKKEFHDIILR